MNETKLRRGKEVRHSACGILHSTFPHAFTLVELIVAIAIFAIFVATAIGAYLQLSVALKRENIDRKLYTEIESVITDIQRQAKFYDIDYPGDPPNESTLPWPVGAANPPDSLSLVSHDGTSKIHYKLTDKGEIGMLKETCSPLCLPANGFQTGQFLPLTSNEMTVEYLAFYAYPTDPDKVNDTADPNAIQDIIYQPKVTIVIRGEIRNPYRREPLRFAIQTSISMRHYQ